jgi:prepilin-type N-terminal cleavage/methylation domain-containing protein
MSKEGVFINYFKKSQGFSMTEVLIAIVLLFVCSMGLANIHILSIRNNAKNNCKTTAINLAQQQLESFKRLPLSDLQAITTTGDVVTVASRNYTRTWTIVNNVPGANTSTVTVTVSWPGATAPVTLQTVMAG